MINTSAVVIAGEDVVLWPGPKCLDTTIALAPLRVHPTVDQYMAISTQWLQRNWTHKKDPAKMKVKSLVEDIRSNVLTFCNNGQGSTYLRC